MTCSKCGERPRQVFNGKVRAYCDPCAAEGKRAWREANADRNRANKRAWHAANSERIAEAQRAIYAERHKHQTRILEEQRQHRRDHPEVYAARKREKNRAFREANREHVRAYLKAWVATHPERRREIARVGTQTRRARFVAAFVEKVRPGPVWERDNGICHICGQPADPARWHLDHVIPLARGGEHSYANVRVSHPLCNVRKNARLVESVA